MSSVNQCMLCMSVGKGTGQGLAIAYAVMVKKHGGTLTFETEVGKDQVLSQSGRLEWSHEGRGGASCEELADE